MKREFISYGRASYSMRLIARIRNSVENDEDMEHICEILERAWSRPFQALLMCMAQDLAARQNGQEYSPPPRLLRYLKQHIEMEATHMLENLWKYNGRPN